MNTSFKTERSNLLNYYLIRQRPDNRPDWKIVVLLASMAGLLFGSIAYLIATS